MLTLETQKGENKLVIPLAEDMLTAEALLVVALQKQLDYTPEQVRATVNALWGFFAPFTFDAGWTFFRSFRLRLETDSFGRPVLAEVEEDENE